MSGRIARISGATTRMRALDAILLPSMRHMSCGSFQSSGATMDGGRPCALHASATVALLHLLPIHGGRFRECRRHGKCVVALRDSPLSLEICSSIIQSWPSSANVSPRAAVFLTHAAATLGRSASTWGHALAVRGCPLSSMSARDSMSSASPVWTLGSSNAMSSRKPQMYRRGRFWGRPMFKGLSLAQVVLYPACWMCARV